MSGLPPIIVILLCLLSRFRFRLVAVICSILSLGDKYICPGMLIGIRSRVVFVLLRFWGGCFSADH